MQNNGIEVIPNVRFGDERTFSFCFDGIEKHKTVAVGTYGCIKTKTNKECFKKGLAELVRVLSPENIVVYGAAPDSIFKTYIDSGVNIIHCKSEFISSGKQVTA